MDEFFLSRLWAAMPPEMKLLFGVFLGVTVHVARNWAIPIVEGLAGAFTSLIGGYLFIFGVCFLSGWNMSDYWWAGGAAGFIANFLLGGMETIGKQIRDSPIKWIIETGLDAWGLIKDRFKKT